MKVRNVNILRCYKPILKELSDIFDFEYYYENTRYDNRGWPNDEYTISVVFFATKSHVDDFIVNGVVGHKYGRSKVLYDLYACRYLTISDIEYPNYNDWKLRWGNLTIDHRLPKYRFPEWTFNCEYWQPLSREENRKKGTNFLREGLEELAKLKAKLNTA